MSKTHPRVRPWRAALLASLALNLFLAAVIGGHLARGHRGRSDADVALGLARAEAGLAPADAARFDAAMRRDRPRYAAAAQDLAEARRAVRRQIAAQPYDPVATRQALAAWRRAWSVFMDEISPSLAQALGVVSPGARAKLAGERRPLGR